MPRDQHLLVDLCSDQQSPEGQRLSDRYQINHRSSCLVDVLILGILVLLVQDVGCYCNYSKFSLPQTFPRNRAMASAS